MKKNQYQTEWDKAHRAVKQGVDQETTLTSLGNMKAGEIAEQVMNKSQSKMQSMSVFDYATNVGAVYIFYTECDHEHGVEREAFRFITDGQNSRSEGNGKRNHNAVLMWNPFKKEFPNNICPYEERFKHGFEGITKMDCFVLGIDYVMLVDAEMTREEGLMIEKCCHHTINDLQLGKQRLHRVPGASAKKPEDGTTQRQIIGATFLPPGFFEKKPDIVVVGSHDGQHSVVSV
jgi:hypothetical protein